MPKYSYVNLCTIYDGNCNGIGFRTNLKPKVCFGSSLSRFTLRQNTANYTIVLITSDGYVVKKSCNNYCMMTKHQLENYLRRIASIKPFKYKVYQDTYDKCECFKIDLHITGSRKETTFVLQCIKRCYEWPYNFFLHQAYEMQKLPAFKFDSILNLFNVAFSSYIPSKNTDHCFSGNTKFEKYATLREKLPHIHYAHELYPEYCNKTIRATNKFPEISLSGGIPNDTTQWDDAFKRTLPIYIENYNVLKK